MVVNNFLEPLCIYSLIWYDKFTFSNQSLTLQIPMQSRQYQHYLFLSIPNSTDEEETELEKWEIISLTMKWCYIGHLAIFGLTNIYSFCFLCKFGRFLYFLDKHLIVENIVNCSWPSYMRNYFCLEK